MSRRPIIVLMSHCHKLLDPKYNLASLITCGERIGEEVVMARFHVPSTICLEGLGNLWKCQLGRPRHPHWVPHKYESGTLIA
jgi:hypothetical protein